MLWFHRGGVYFISDSSCNLQGLYRYAHILKAITECDKTDIVMINMDEVKQSPFSFILVDKYLIKDDTSFRHIIYLANHNGF